MDPDADTHKHCCVPECTSDSRYNPELHFHKIPKEAGRKAEWVAKIRLDEGELFSANIARLNYC